jgi:hypothetical protein
MMVVMMVGFGLCVLLFVRVVTAWDLGNQAW